MAIPPFGSSGYDAFQDQTADFPQEFKDDDVLMNFVGSLFDEQLTGDQWHFTRDGLEEYLWSEYELVFDDFFDWADYGEWYDSVH